MNISKHLVAGSFAALIAGAVLLPLSASADDADLRAVNNRLDRLERSVNDMRQNEGGSSSNGASSSVSLNSDAGVRLGQMEEQMRLLNGRIEELTHQLDVVNKDLSTYKEATDLRFQDLNTTGPAAGAAAAPTAGKATVAAGAPAAASAAPTVQLPAGTAQVQYDFGIGLLKQGQFPQARDAFKQFLVQHPKDPLAGNAQYWLGETYYAQGQYKDAADSFLKGYTTYSKSTKAPDSLLKLGMTLTQLKQKDAACATFGQLKEQFPNASPAIVARNKQERQKAGC
ncbi:MAG: tol-pal system protein YbgF [Parvibaculum sp.]|nr:tol-pal system protein YbgF [Parvibaculum sp.]